MLGLNITLWRSGNALLEGAFQTYVLPMLDADGEETEVRAAVSGRLSIGAGTRF